jgi:hypothetical protein
VLSVSSNTCDAPEAVVKPVKVACTTLPVIVIGEEAELPVTGAIETAPAALNDIPPVPDWIVVVEVVFVLPKVTVLAAPPVPIDRVVAFAFVEMPRAPVPELIVNAPFVDVTLRAPDPDCRVVAEVEFVDPNVQVFTAPPVPTLTVVAAASLEMLRAPVPEVIATAPFVPVIAMPPDPDCRVVAEVVFVLPTTTVFAAPPVPNLQVVAATSSDMLKFPVPDATVIAALVPVIPILVPLAIARAPAEDDPIVIA